MTSGDSNSVNNLTKEEVIKRKIRNAVYVTLAENGIVERHPLFKKCFKRLFDVCSMFAGMQQKQANNQSLKQLLADVARSNVKTIVDIEKANFQEQKKKSKPLVS